MIIKPNVFDSGLYDKIDNKQVDVPDNIQKEDLKKLFVKEKHTFKDNDIQVISSNPNKKDFSAFKVILDQISKFLPQHHAVAVTRFYVSVIKLQKKKHDEGKTDIITGDDLLGIAKMCFGKQVLDMTWTVENAVQNIMELIGIPEEKRLIADNLIGLFMMTIGDTIQNVSQIDPVTTNADCPEQSDN